ncbi:MAG: type VI secretion system tip protein TssI/VgrG [Phycisphaerales bacterium]
MSRRRRRNRVRPIEQSLESLRKQAGRQWAVRTPLGEDALLMEWFRGREEVSRLYEFEVGLLSEHSGVNAKSLLGREVSIHLALPGGGQRYFGGVVSSFVEEPGWDDLAVYRMTVVPWLWLLTRTHDCRIYQDMTVPEIMAETFRRYGMSNFDFRLSREKAMKREFCVQYRESAFNFVSRLMEEEGIAYHVEHHADRHVLVLTDAAGARKPFPGYEEVPLGNESGGKVDREQVWDVRVGEEVRPGAYASTDYNFENPKDNLNARTVHALPHMGGDFEVFDYPGRYHLYPSGELSTKIRLLELQTGHAWLEGESDARGLAPGRVFSLTGATARDRRSLLVASAEYEGRGDGFDSGPGSAERAAELGLSIEETFRVRFTATPGGEEYLPAQITPKPTIQGPQTAFVVGDAGKEIDVDRYGRIKVHFHWDRHLPQDDHNSSCRIRVSQPWAGLSYGGLAIPRIGHEVVVEFLEGDPDKPLVTGRVYNASRKVPISGVGKDTRQKLRRLSPPLKAPPSLHHATAGGGPAGASGAGSASWTNSSGGVAGQAAATLVGAAAAPGAANAQQPRPGVSAATVVGAASGGSAIPQWEGRSAASRLLQATPGGESGGAGWGASAAGGGSGELAAAATPEDNVNPPDSIEHAAQLTTIRSNSLGKTGGCNEITMDDTSGAEGLFLKAQHDETHVVGNDQAVSIGNNRTTQVGVDSLEKIGNNMSLQVGVNAQESVGVAKIVDVGSTLVLRAGTSITLQCGASLIHMNQAGVIFIKGSIVQVQGSLNCGISAPTTFVAGALLANAGVVTVSEGAVVNRIDGGTTVMTGNPVKINPT